jgi:hypothetical protein
MSNHSELRNLRSERVHFNNKYKFMMLKSTTMPQIKEAFVGSQRKYGIYITISVWVLFWSLVYKHNHFKKIAFLISSLRINFRFNVGVLATLMIHTWFKQICATRYQTDLESQLNNFWTWNNYVNEIPHRGFCRTDKKYMSTVRGSSVVLRDLLH